MRTCLVGRICCYLLAVYLGVTTTVACGRGMASGIQYPQNIRQRRLSSGYASTLSHGVIVMPAKHLKQYSLQLTESERSIKSNIR